jgi:hypothetical protein
MRFLPLTLVACFIFVFGALPSVAEPRVALVIGNSDYGAEMGKLPNPANDAALMAKTLKQVGFDVITVTNADQNKMKQAIKEFGRKLTSAGAQTTGLFFYAGHGLQFDGENYLIPVHAAIEQEGDVDVEAIPASMVLKQMDFSGASVNIVILDACRNNPLARSMRSTGGGLAEMKERPTGSFIAYSTAPGQTAVDGKGKNSPYTEALAAAILTPGAGIEDVFRNVRGKVLKVTDQKQVPWDASSLTAPFYFMPGSANASKPVATTDTPSTPDEKYWDNVKDSKSAGDYEAYLKKYPDGEYADLAKSRIDELKQTKVASAATPDANANTVQRTTPDSASGGSSTDFEDLDQTIYSKNGAVIHDKPERNSSTLKKLSANQQLHATGVSTDGNWWRVSMSNGKTGYIHKTVIREPTPAQTADASGSGGATTNDSSGAAASSSSNFIEPIQGGSTVVQPTYQTQPTYQQQGPTITFGGGSNNGQVNGIGALATILGSSAANNQQPRQPTVSFTPESKKLMVRSGTVIRPVANFGASPIARLTADGELQGAARSNDGLWWRIRMPDGRTGFIESNGVIE